MVLYGINLIPLTEDIWATDPALLALFYMDAVEFDGSPQQRACLLTLLHERVTDWGYFTETDKSLFICDYNAQEG